jgi:hypothetical protein
MKSWKEIGLVVVLMAISAAPRFAGLGAFTSVDEPFWLRQGANFYYALGQREFQNTLYEYHPAVTTMWLVAVGMLLYFPQYRAMEQGYLKPGKFDLFLPAHDKDPLQLLVVSRALQVVVILVLLLAMFLLLRKLFGSRAAFVATGLVSFAPFLMGQSRLLNHEAMMGLFIVVSLLALLTYMWESPHIGLLLISGAGAALAQLSKSSGALVFPIGALAIAVEAFRHTEPGWGKRLSSAARTLGIWLLITAGSYVLFWPGMWVAPLSMLSDVYGNALSYTFQGARLSVLPGLDAGSLGVDTLLSGLQFYGNDIIWRSSPISWLGFAAGLGTAVVIARRSQNYKFPLLALYLMLVAAGYLLLFSVQRGPKPPHYTLTSYISLDLIAGLGLVELYRLFGERWPALQRTNIEWSAYGFILLLQLGSAITFFPYYITYYNPVAESLQPGIQNPTLEGTGYGVGLDQAAAYLARKPDADNLTVMSANGYGCFSYYFPGHTVPMNNLILSDPEIVKILHSSQYAVVDYYNQRRKGLLGGLDNVSPEKTIWLNGIDFLRIYRASDVLASIGESTP